MPRSSRQVDAFESRSGHASWRRGKEKKTKRKETSRCAGPCACTSEDFSVIQRRASLQRATGHVPVVMTSSATEFNLQRPPLPLNFRPSLPTLCVPVVSRAGIILGNGPRVSGALSIFLCPKNRRRLVRNLISCFLLARASRPARGRAYESLNYRRWNCLFLILSLSSPPSSQFMRFSFSRSFRGNTVRPDRGDLCGCVAAQLNWT